MINKHIFVRIWLTLLVFVLVMFCVPFQAFAVSGAWVFDHAESYVSDNTLAHESYTYSDNACTFFYDTPFNDESTNKPVNDVEILYSWDEPPALIPFGQESECGLWVTVTFNSHPGSNYYNNSSNSIELKQSVGPRQADIAEYYERQGENWADYYIPMIRSDLGGLLGTTDFLENESGIIEEHIIFSAVRSEELRETETAADWSSYWGESENEHYELRITVNVDNYYYRTYVYLLDESVGVAGTSAYEEEDDLYIEDYGNDALSSVATALLVAGGTAILVVTTVFIVRSRRKNSPTSVTKRETIQNKPEVTDWQGNIIDENARVQQTYQEYTQVNREAMEQRDVEYQRTLQEKETATQKMIDNHNTFLERLNKKYFGTISHSDNSASELFKRFMELRDFETQEAAKLLRNAKKYGYAEYSATVVSMGSDAFIDVAGDFTGPVGKGLRAGYKVITGGIKKAGEKGYTFSSIMEGAARGAGDAASDFISVNGTTKKQLAKQLAGKMGVQFVGESMGEILSGEGSVGNALQNTAVKTTLNVFKDRVNNKEFGDLGKKALSALEKEVLKEGSKRYIISGVGSQIESAGTAIGGK